MRWRPTCRASGTRRSSLGPSTTSGSRRSSLSGPAAVVGCSFGARVALELAASRPELVERLVLIGVGLAPWDWSEEAQKGFEEEEEALERGDLAAAAAQQARMWLADSAEPSVRELTEAMTIRSYEQQLPVEGQVKTVWPEPPAAGAARRDPRRRRSSSSAPRTSPTSGPCRSASRSEIPGAALETIEGAGHLPSIERPAELNRLLLDFLR